MPLRSQTLPSKVKIGTTYVGEGEPTFFIAEIGNNHNGDYELAVKTVEAAVAAGADAVKFQKRFVEEVFAKELLEKPQTKDTVFGKTYGEYRRAQELDFDEFVRVKRLAEERGIIFFATPFDKKSVDFLEEVGVDVYKVASFDVTHLPLLDYLAQKRKPIFLSAGTSTLEELDEAIDLILQYNNQLIINHCVSIYPAPDERLNLLTIPYLRERYAPLPIGYSGHEHDIMPTLAAVALGAKSIERHFTVDRTLPGPDHATVSVEPHEFKMLVDEARRLEKALGSPAKMVFPEELTTREKHGKSIVSRVPIPAGTVITADMLCCKSPGYGLKPAMLPRVISRSARGDIPADTVLKHYDIIW